MTSKKPAVYLAFGTRKSIMYDGDGKEATRQILGAPWKIYAVGYVTPEGTGLSPYYRAVGMNGKGLVLEELVQGSHEYRKVQKWVGDVERSKTCRTAERKVLRSINPRCVVDEKAAKTYFSWNWIYSEIDALPEEEARNRFLEYFGPDNWETKKI